MKYFLLLTFISLSSILGYSQENSFIIGSWKTIAHSDINMYMNLETDSIALYGGIAIMNADTTSQKNILQYAKNIYSKLQYHFEKNGIFKQISDTITVLTGTYKIDTTNRKLEFTVNLLLTGSRLTEALDYEFTDNIFKFFSIQNNKRISMTALRKVE